MKSVKQFDINKVNSVDGLINEMSEVGVMGCKRLANAVKIIRDMTDDKECTVFLGVAGALIPGGMQQVIISLLKKCDVFVTTGAMLTHDLVEALGFSHYQGSQYADDEELNKKGLDRMYDSYMSNDVYKKLEKFIEKHIGELKNVESVRELLQKIGSFLPENSKSILRFCYDNEIPIFCPAIADSGLGLMFWGQLVRGINLELKVFISLREILDIAWNTKKSGVIYVCGGVPKNYIQQAMQFSKQAFYGVQITTDRPEWGGSSGAPLKEGVSWGKMDARANFIDLIADATIVLPIIASALEKK